jgi:hypothetical protein
MPHSLVAKRPALNRMTAVRFGVGLPISHSARLVMARPAKPWKGRSIRPCVSIPLAQRTERRSSTSGRQGFESSTGCQLCRNWKWRFDPSRGHHGRLTRRGLETPAKRSAGSPVLIVPAAFRHSMRAWYIDCAPVFQAGEASLILAARAILLSSIS